MTEIQNVAAKGWRPNGRQIGIAVVVALIALFGALNFEKTTIDFLVASVKIQLVFVIAACSLLGVIVGYLLARHLDKKD